MGMSAPDGLELGGILNPVEGIVQGLNISKIVGGLPLGQLTSGL